jgi:hypothetical protein
MGYDQKAILKFKLKNVIPKNNTNLLLLLRGIQTRNKGINFELSATKFVNFLLVANYWCLTLPETP